MTTATEILMNTMESLGTGEANAMIIVWTDANGDLNIRTSCVSSHAIGLARWGEAYLMAQLIGDEG